MVQPKPVPLTIEIKFEHGGCADVEIRVGLSWRGLLGAVSIMKWRIPEVLEEMFP